MKKADRYALCFGITVLQIFIALIVLLAIPFNIGSFMMESGYGVFIKYFNTSDFGIWLDGICIMIGACFIIWLLVVIKTWFKYNWKWVNKTVNGYDTPNN